MDRLKPASRVITMVASNWSRVIELALGCPRGFNRELEMVIPDKRGRLKILQIKTHGMHLGQDVDL